MAPATALAVIVLVWPLLAGCGGGGKAALTKSEWIARAQAVCVRAGETLDALAPESFASQADFAREVDETFDDYVADLRSLAPPKEDEATIELWLDLQEELASAWAELLESDSGSKADSIFNEKVGPLATRADRLIREYGAEGCAVD